MEVDAIAQAAVTVGAPLVALVSVGSRRRRLRNDIKENLALLAEIEKYNPLREQTMSSAWLQGRIALDIAKLTGQEFGAKRRKVAKGPVISAIVVAVLFGWLTYWIDRHGFQWYSVFPGIVSGFAALSALGQFTNREIPEGEALPPGAVRAPTDTAAERVATAVAIAASGGFDDRLEPGHQADVALKFVKLLQLGEYESAIKLADPIWIECRIRSWLWNNQAHFGSDEAALTTLVGEMLNQREQSGSWRDFVATEAGQFRDTWSTLDFDHYGIAGNRRRISRDLDLVILVPLGELGGYFVTEATTISGALMMLVRGSGSTWQVVNHIGIAPPTPEWPPVWWATDDPVINGLPDE